MSFPERDIGYSYKICDIEVKGSRVIINALDDYDRTEQGYAWHWTLSEELNDNYDELEYSNNSIINRYPNSSRGTYKRSEREHPLCEKLLEDRKRCVEAAKTAKPLELEEIKYLPEAKKYVLIKSKAEAIKLKIDKLLDYPDNAIEKLNKIENILEE